MSERLIEIGPEDMWTSFLEEANQLFQEEKVAWHENDQTKLADICKRIIQLSFDHKEFSRLNQFILLITKKRGQSKKAITEMITLSVSLIDQMPTRIDRMNLIQAIREATEGKFFVEVEYANCTWLLSEMYEEDGDQ